MASVLVVTSHRLTNEQEYGGGDAKPQDGQQEDNQHAFHGKPPFLFVPIFIISVRLRWREVNSVDSQSFEWEEHPTTLPS
jgi:hypothetical protein